VSRPKTKRAKKNQNDANGEGPSGDKKEPDEEVASPSKSKKGSGPSKGKK
jgi:hypothetical protein